MIAPEKWRRNESFTCAENIARRSLPLPFCHDPVLYPNAACARIGPARDIAGGKDSRDVCFQKFIYQYAFVRRDLCFFSKRSIRTHAYSNDHQVTIKTRPIIKPPVSVVVDSRRSPQIKFYTVRFVTLRNSL